MDDAVAGRNAVEMFLVIYKSMKTGLPGKLPLDDFASTEMKSMVWECFLWQQT